MKISILKQKCFRLENVILYRVMNIYIYFFDIIYNLSAMGREQKTLLTFIHSVVNEVYDNDKYV